MPSDPPTDLQESSPENGGGTSFRSRAMIAGAAFAILALIVGVISYVARSDSSSVAAAPPSGPVDSSAPLPSTTVAPSASDTTSGAAPTTEAPILAPDTTAAAGGATTSTGPPPLVPGEPSDSSPTGPTDSTAGASTTVSDVAVAPTCPPASGAPRTIAFTSPPPLCIDVTHTYKATIRTSKGSMTFALDPVAAPKTVNNFVFLARYHFYDGLTFHRIVTDFVAQGGDPLGTGEGGPGYLFPDELPPAGSYKVGSLAMANLGKPDTNGSQFFIVTGQLGQQLPPTSSLFGRLTEGTSTLAAIAAEGTATGTPLAPVQIQAVTITESGGSSDTTVA